MPSEIWDLCITNSETWSSSTSHLSQEIMLDKVSIVSHTRPHASKIPYSPTCYEKQTGDAGYDPEDMNSLTYFHSPLWDRNRRFFGHERKVKDAYWASLLLHSLCSIIVFLWKFLILGSSLLELKSVSTDTCHVICGFNNHPNKSFTLKSNLAKYILLESPPFLLTWIWQKDCSDSSVSKARYWI